jgi:hypothetical protein
MIFCDYLVEGIGVDRNTVPVGNRVSFSVPRVVVNWDRSNLSVPKELFVVGFANFGWMEDCRIYWVGVTSFIPVCSYRCFRCVFVIIFAFVVVSLRLFGVVHCNCSCCSCCSYCSCWVSDCFSLVLVVAILFFSWNSTF